MFKHLRLERNLTLKELASQLPIDEKRIKVIERGLDVPTQEEQELLSSFFYTHQGLVFDLPTQKQKERIIGEGYVTAVNKSYKVYEPKILRSENKLKVLDLFCGVGGISYGFEQTGNFTTIGGLDLLHDRINTFQLNHSHAFGFSFDISAFEPSELYKYLPAKPDIIVGGAPCQGFSSIRPFRSLTEDDSRNSLFKQFARYVDFFKPSWFVFENVVGLLTHKNGQTLKILVNEFSSLGYNVEFKVLNSAYYGVPQLRERLIVVGNSLGVKFDWAKPSHFYPFKSMAGNSNSAILKPKSSKDTLPATTVMQAISDLPPVESGQKANYYLPDVALTDYQKYLRNGSTELNDHEATVHSPQMLEIIKASGYNIEAVKHLVTSGFSTSYSRLEPNKPSVTLTVNFVNPSSNKCIHPTQNRALTVREGARLQGFPDCFKFSGTRTQIVKQIGNAVPPVLSKVIADAIFRYY